MGPRPFTVPGSCSGDKGVFTATDTKRLLIFKLILTLKRLGVQGIDRRLCAPHPVVAHHILLAWKTAMC